MAVEGVIAAVPAAIVAETAAAGAATAGKSTLAEATNVAKEGLSPAIPGVEKVAGTGENLSTDPSGTEVAGHVESALNAGGTDKALEHLAETDLSASPSTTGKGAELGKSNKTASNDTLPSSEATSGSIMTPELAEKTMREKLSGLSGNNREEDPRWKEVYDQMPDYMSNQPPPSAGEDAYQKWSSDSKAQIASYREKADDALRASDPQAFENYKRYGMYTNPDGTKNPHIDPEAKQLFFDENGNPHTPTPEEISQFEAQYPEKAAFYSEDISALKSKDANINKQPAEEGKPATEGESEPEDTKTTENTSKPKSKTAESSSEQAKKILTPEELKIQELELRLQNMEKAFDGLKDKIAELTKYLVNKEKDEEKKKILLDLLAKIILITIVGAQVMSPSSNG